MPNQLSIFVKPPRPSFEENPDRMFWSKWHWLDAVADWNWAGYEDTSLQVNVYSSCDEVELFLNNKSLGRKKTERSARFMATWDVPYQPGLLKAIGYQGKKQVNSATLQTSNEVSQIKLTADRTKIKSDGQDLSYITVELTDANGIRNPKAENLVSFKIEGPGTIVGVGNANPVSLESYQLPHRKAWQGRCLVVIKSANQPGEIRLRASSEGISAKEIKIETGINLGNEKPIAAEIPRTYKNGTFTGISRSRYTTEPFWGKVFVRIENGEFENISFTIRDSSLHETFTSEYSKHYEGNPVYVQQVINDWKGVQNYPKKLLRKQNSSKVDCITGATWSYNIFQAALEEALKNANK
jgi:major membrane immunogen (membrane-anchored lipoprotein)